TQLPWEEQNSSARLARADALFTANILQMARPDPTALKQVQQWFAARGWEVFDFQSEVWKAYLEGKSGLVHSATGTGKTLAAWLGPLLEAATGNSKPGLKVLWLTPLRALAADTVNALRAPLQDLKSDSRVTARYGDTTS